MPELIMERPKMSLQMHETLKKYILRERKKKKEEDVANEQKMKEEMRKAEMNTQTLEQNKQQINKLQLKLEDLQLKKRDLFNQLKKVLNEETNLKKSNRPFNVTPQSTLPIQYGQQGLNISSGHHSSILSNNPDSSNILVYSQTNSLSGTSSQLITQSPGLLPAVPNNSSKNILVSNTPRSGPSPSHILNNNSTNQLINNKNNSLFHNSQNVASHIPQNFSLMPSNQLKYFANSGLAPPSPLSPQILVSQAVGPALNQHIQPNTHQSSPNLPISSNSMTHILNHSIVSPSNSPRHQNQLTQISKRQRSPSPSSSPVTSQSILSAHQSSQYVFNQNNLITPSSSPSLAMVPSSSPPNIQSQLFNSPISGKKSRSSSISQNIVNSPIGSNQLSQHQQNIPRHNAFNTQTNSVSQAQQQSAFSTYQHNNLMNNRNINSFQTQPSSPQIKQFNSSQTSHNTIQSFSPLSSSQSISSSNFGLPRNLGSQSSIGTFPSITSQYLNVLAHDHAQKLFQAQQQQQIMQQQLNIVSAPNQQHTSHHLIHHHSNSSPNNLSNSSANNGGGGSILTGFSIRSSGSSSNIQQHPSNSY